MKIVHGANPVREALRSGRPIRAIHIARSAGGATRQIKQDAQRAGVRVTESSKEELTKRVGHADHQGVIALLEEATKEGARRDATVESILEDARAAGEDPLVVLVDHVQDPHNLGAIMRSVWALGAHGVIIPKDRAVQMTPSVIKASAGAALHVPLVSVTNLKHALEELKEAGVWSAAAVLDGEPAHQARLAGPLALVVGAEDKGVAPTIAGRCDLRVRIPLSRGFDSLNASVAAGILLYEATRQRIAG